MQTDRRKFQRYTVIGQVYAVFKPEPVKIAPILDISMRGMAVGDDNHIIYDENVSDLEIMSSDCSIYLDKIPFQFVSDIPDSEPHIAVADERRIVRIKFGRLLGNQEAHLRQLLRSHCTGSYKPRSARRFARFFDQFKAPRELRDTCRNILAGKSRSLG